MKRRNQKQGTNIISRYKNIIYICIRDTPVNKYTNIKHMHGNIPRLKGMMFSFQKYLYAYMIHVL